MIERLFDSGAMPVLERVVQFTAQRHKVLAHSIANISTPNFQPRDLDTDSFQQALADAIDTRREKTGGINRPLEIRDTDQLSFRDGGIDVDPPRANDNILFHDRNNRSLERLMQHLAENAGAHNASLELLRSEFGMLETAIRERV